MYNKRISIDPKVDAELKKLAYKISKNHSKFNKKIKVGEISFKNDIGEDGFVEIFAKNNFEFEAKIDGKTLDSLFIIVGADPNPITVYNSLYHEMLHATDPEFLDEEAWENYDPDIDASYYGHRLEFRTLTNEFLNALYNLYKDKLKGSTSSTKKRLHDSLTNIVNYYLHDDPLTDFSADLLDYAAGSTKYSVNKLKDFYSKVQLEYPGDYNLTISSYNREKLPVFVRGYLNKVREHNPTQWSDFISTLLSTREEISDLF